MLGAVSSGLIFGTVSLMAQKPAPPQATQAPLEKMQVSVPEPIQNTPKKIASQDAEIIPPVDTPLFKSLLSPEADAHSIRYEVKSGDNLTTISKKNNTTIELLKKINNLPNDKLMPGMKLKIPAYKFSVVVDKSQNSLILKGDEEVLKTYTVSTGTDNSTPIGVFKITDRLVNPTWYKAGAVVPHGSPENVLGTRWLGFTLKGYGIHGTTEPEKLGQQVTAGCVRMRNEEVEELYGFLASGTEVTIVD